LRLSILVLALAACGVSDSSLLTELSDSQAVSLCEEYGEKEITCGEGEFTFTFTFGADCDTTTADETPAECTATVGDYRDCFDAIYAMTDEEFCNSEDIPECDALFTATCSGGE
jgi:hypothetical protein